MYIFDEYKRFNSIFDNVNDFIYKNRINTIINYYNENIKNNSEYINKINYEYYKYFDINAIEILESKTNNKYIPDFRLLIYNNIEENTFGIHRYGWKNVISNFLKQNYYENDDFYKEYPDFEWTSYAKEYDLHDYNNTIEHFLQNIEYKTQMIYNKMKYIIFDEWFEKKYVWKNTNSREYNYNFISFIHDPPIYSIPDELYKKNEKKDLKKLFEKNEEFLKEKERLKILICLSDYQKKYIEKNINLQETTVLKTIYHPLEVTNKKYMFDIKKYIENENKTLFFIGWWLRKYDIFLKLSCKKIIVMKTNEGSHVNSYIINEIRKNISNVIEDDSIEHSSNKNDLIEYINKKQDKKEFEITKEELEKLNIVYNTEINDFIENKEYDTLFHQNIIFLDIYDSIANNIVLECIMNNTPLLVCYNKSIIEYLGINYPFYFTNYEDAEKKSRDIELVLKTHYYLKNMDKSKFTYQYFNNELKNIIMDNI
jgi:hypothetical protein